MSAMTLHAGLFWTGSHEEDRRFHRILVQSLVFCLGVGVIAPYIRIPQPDTGVAEELPARRVRLLAEPFVSAPATAQLAVKPAVTAPPKPQTLPAQLPAAPVVTPRQKAARSGVLAMSDALTELQGTKPKIATRARPDNVTAGMNTAGAQPSMLTLNVTRGSKGIEGGVAHQSVLGTSGLPDREDSSQGTSGREGKVPARGRASATLSAVLRSQAEIQEILDRNKGAMYTLYNRELRKDATLQGKLVMDITIAPAGKVSRCVILSSELGAVALEQQLVALIKGIDFGSKPGAPAVTTKLPIEFFPR